eukprot:CAMPEP_0201565204 /NCGR_PEP_ID=MMETSP0190_2-20130828/4151_1 /ASSEMBLY_ACC=CAM_ASM_000263 /TAXON_ID=37353 /ORGANISM="Rosalina sp." /LENGTH=829 /DNA_ID=CAMNT_0047982425 /DNA_START=487 /DNA_END=2976 /DNA_ORIENTATION=+
MTINAQNGGDVSVNCNDRTGGVCNAVKLNCGTGDCTIDCAGANIGAAVKCNSIQVTYTAATRSFNCIGDPLTECFAAPVSFGPPTTQPTANPLNPPSLNPTLRPTTNPTQVTKTPSSIPTIPPTKVPTGSPITARPTSNPTTKPTNNPSVSPSNMPSASPTDPSLAPTRDPTVKGQTLAPSKSPTKAPTTKAPTTSSPTTKAPNTPQPTTKPPTSQIPTNRPTTRSPSSKPTIPGIPSIPTLPQIDPTTAPPTPLATDEPTANPTTSEPTTASPTSDQTDGEICCECAAATLSTQGCARDPGCTKTICELDPYCCENQWDNTCAYYASDQCAKTQQIAPQPTTPQTQESPSDLDLVWKFALVVFAVMVFIVSCCIILLRIHRMCQNCKQKKLLQQKSVSAKNVKKRGDGKLMRRGDSIKKLKGSDGAGIHGHRIIAANRSPQPQPTPANSSAPSYTNVHLKSRHKKRSNSNGSTQVDDESMTMTHEDEYEPDDDDEQRDVVPNEELGIKRQQSHKMYFKRQYYSSNGGMHGEHGQGIPISGVQSVGSSHYSSQYGGMSSMNNSYNNPYGTQHRGINLVNNMAHFVAPRSLPAHNKLNSNSVPPRHVIMGMGNGAHIDLEYGTEDRSAMMGQDRFVVTDHMIDDDHHDPDEDSMDSMSGDTAFGVHSPNAFARNNRAKVKRDRQVKDSMNSSIDSYAHNNNIHHVRSKNPNKMKRLKKESTETSVDDSEVALEDVANELKQEMLELKETAKGSKKSKSKKNKKQRERGQSAVRQVEVKGQCAGPGQEEEDSNNNSQNSEDTDEEVTVSDDPISEIMNGLKRMQSVKHHSI